MNPQWMVSTEAIAMIRELRDQHFPFWDWFRKEWVSQVHEFGFEYRHKYRRALEDDNIADYMAIEMMYKIHNKDLMCCLLAQSTVRSVVRVFATGSQTSP